MKLLALDQASRITGYAVFEDGQLITFGKIVTEESDVGVRLMKIRKSIQRLIEDYQIDEVVMEDIQLQSNVQNNVQTFKTLAEVFGVIYELLTEMNIPNSAVLSTSWKSTLGIKGRTRPEQKRNAQEFVINTFGKKPTQDECDAICIGCHKIKNGQEVKDYDWSE